MRKLAADSLAYDNPLSRFPEGSTEHQEWEDLLRRNPDLLYDLALLAGRQFDVAPWDNSSAYNEKEASLAELWDDHIMKTRTMDDVRKCAEVSRAVSSLLPGLLLISLGHSAISVTTGTANSDKF